MSFQRFKTVKNANYTTINNTCLKDKNISLKAKGLFAIVMSLPDNWNFTIEGIIEIVKESETAVYSAIKELVDFGYCTKTNFRQKGRFLGVEYSFNEIPKVVLPCAENPNAVKTDLENVGQLSKDNQVSNELSKQETKKEKTQSKNFANSPSSFEVVSLADNNIQMQKEKQNIAGAENQKSLPKEKTKEGGGEFEIFCNAYPNKLGKSKSETKFAAAAKKIGFDNLMLCVENYKTFVDAERKNGFPNLAYKHLATFLNGSYEDFLVNEKQVQIDNSPKYKGISLATEVNMKIAGGAQSKLDLGFVLRLAIRTPQNIHNITYNGTGISLEELPQITQLLKNTKYEN